ncbi:hypothetical protein B0H19DRAFT_1190376 [Mycena capillaripes]|nr:hypothetical protein B0H19DRAFT_1201190 [Mycena capillaripes]KAJ6531088.1 hypothetical protein B0H19DRAFT_1190376 [Mycena capillaripes]
MYLPSSNLENPRRQASSVLVHALTVKPRTSPQNSFKPELPQAIKVSTCRPPHPPHLIVNCRPRFKYAAPVKHSKTKRESTLRRIWTACTCRTLLDDVLTLVVDADGAKSPPLALLFHRLQHHACRALSPPLSSPPLPTSPPFPPERALPTCPRCDPIPRSTTTPPVHVPRRADTPQPHPRRRAPVGYMRRAPA